MLTNSVIYPVPSITKNKISLKMKNSIFSTYSQGENRVTSTIVSVFRKINLSTLQEILKYVLNDSTIELIVFKDQFKKKDKKSVPDARISASFDYLIETKIVRDSLKKNQIEWHLEYLGESLEKDEKFIFSICIDCFVDTEFL